MEYYSAMRKKDIVPFATTCLNVEGIMLSEISQRKTNTAWYYHLYVESKKAKLRETESRVVVPGDWRVEGMESYWSKGTDFQL